MENGQRQNLSRQTYVMTNLGRWPTNPVVPITNAKTQNFLFGPGRQNRNKTLDTIRPTNNLSSPVTLELQNVADTKTTSVRQTNI